MSNEKQSILKTYEDEIMEIENKLTQLENYRFMEQTRASYDGALSTNIQKLRGMIKDLLKKIDKDLPSDSDKVADLF
ncbi:hypothetical protein MUN89_17850 [Halobacillus salinarum]|uniref:Uncharacterized protein n=1 Tax=Halobacillus salinarum TaxID=2932257 RepID=A0ABY4EHY0_9BACI|nr:hypothetical protein [Halobacillus salinarum]UOQ43726.1 hypothetical protein MUN89_17850 [Halobacillus salinarum]